MIKYLLARDKPLIAAFLCAVIEDTGLASAHEKFTIDESFRLNVVYMFREENWYEEWFDECPIEENSLRKGGKSATKKAN